MGVELMNTFTPEPWELERVITWEQIRSKAHMYKTARIRATGEYVALNSIIHVYNGLRLLEPMFSCRVAFTENILELTTRELFSFVL
jgi:hypothetical protein